jgi:hypothetical protein
MTEQEVIGLIDKLQKGNVPLYKWGTGTYKSLYDLIKEIDAGEAEVTLHYTNRVFRRIRTVLVDVYYKPCPGDKTFYLVEESQTLANGKSRTRKQQCSVSETLKLDEIGNVDAVCRALLEELGISKGSSCKSSMRYTELPTESKSYPGIYRVAENFRFENYIWDFQYKPEGYTEVRDGITTKFVWKEIEQQDDIIVSFEKRG